MNRWILIVAFILMFNANLSLQQNQLCVSHNGSLIMCKQIGYFEQMIITIEYYIGRTLHGVPQYFYRIYYYLCGPKSETFTTTTLKPITSRRPTTTTTTTTETILKSTKKITSKRPKTISSTQRPQTSTTINTSTSSSYSTTPTTTTKPLQPNYENLQKHPNLKLINDKSCGAYSSNRVIDTFEAQLIEFPWVALLGYKQANGSIDWKCEGTLINKNYVLTSASCVNRDLKQVRLGEHTISTESDCDGYDCADSVQDIAIEKKIKHPGFNSRSRQNDVALLRLKTPADTAKNNVKTICLPVDTEVDFEKLKKAEETFIIFGWGSDEKEDILQRTYAPYIDQQECAKRLGYHPSVKINEAVICAGNDDERNNTCVGDSGSAITALALLSNRPKLFVYGIKSTSTECVNAEANLPAIYTNIRYYLEWILDNIGE